MEAKTTVETKRKLYNEFASQHTGQGHIASLKYGSA